MPRNYPALNAFCGWNRFCGVLAGVAGVTTAFIGLQAGSFTYAGVGVIGGVFGFLSFMATAELSGMAIGARHDLEDVRFYLSSMSRQNQNDSNPVSGGPPDSSDEQGPATR